MDCCRQSTGVQEEERILELELEWECRQGRFRVSATMDLARWLFFASLEASDPHVDGGVWESFGWASLGLHKPSFETRPDLKNDKNDSNHNMSQLDRYTG